MVRLSVGNGRWEQLVPQRRSVLTGMRPSPSEDIPKLEFEAEFNRDHIFRKSPSITLYSPKSGTANDGYNKFLLKLKLALLGNCGFVNYDVIENNKLSLIIKRVNELNFTIEN